MDDEKKIEKKEGKNSRDSQLKGDHPTLFALRFLLNL